MVEALVGPAFWRVPLCCPRVVVVPVLVARVFTPQLDPGCVPLHMLFHNMVVLSSRVQLLWLWAVRHCNR